MRLDTGRLISLDQDPDAVAVAKERLAGLPATVVQMNFRLSLIHIWKSSANVVAKAAVLAEGDAADRTDITFLEPLPLFFK